MFSIAKVMMITFTIGCMSVPEHSIEPTVAMTHDETIVNEGAPEFVTCRELLRMRIGNVKWTSYSLSPIWGHILRAFVERPSGTAIMFVCWTNKDGTGFSERLVEPGAE